jgi:hypothetical protein
MSKKFIFLTTHHRHKPSEFLSMYLVIVLFISTVIFIWKYVGQVENSGELDERILGLEPLKSLLTLCWSFKLWLYFNLYIPRQQAGRQHSGPNGSKHSLNLVYS